MAPALPPRVRAGATATSSSPSSSADPHLLIRSSYSAAVPVVRCFQMPAACVQVGLLHEPQDRVLLNESARRDLIHHDPFFSAFNSVCPLSPSPLLPAPATSPAARQKAVAATDAPHAATPYAYATTDAAKADAADAAETRAAAVEAIEASSVVDDPRLLFCIDEEGHLLLLDWHGSFFEQLRSDGVSSSSSNGGNSSSDSGGNARCTPIHIPSVPPYRVKEAKGALTNSSGNGGDIFSSGSSSNVRCSNTDGGGNLGKHTSGNSSSSLWCNETILPPAPQTAGMLRGDPWYCWSLRASKEEDEEATHIRAAWRVCGPVSCATPVNPLLPDRVAFGGRNNDVKVFDFSQGKYVWAAKNVKDTLLRLRVPVHISSLCWLPQVHPLVLAAGTAAGAVRLYDLRCQRRPVFEQEHACSSSSLGGAAARERRVLCALCAETCDEEAAALLANIRKSRGTHSCSSNTGNGSATWTGIEDERYTSSTCWASNSSHSSKSLVGNRNITRGSSSSGCSNDNVGKKHSSITRNCSRGKANRAGTLETPEPAVLPEDEEERLKIYETVRGLYGKEKTRIFFSDNHGAVYVHRVLTGKALLRRIDPQQKKHNRTSCYAASSSSEAESEGGKADDESQEECSDEESDGEEPEGGCEEGEEGDEEEDEEGEGHREAEQGMEKGEKAKKEDKRQRQHEAASNVLLHRGDTRRINSGSIKTEEIQAGTEAPTTDGAKGGRATTSETSAEMERGGGGPRIAATAGGADAAAGVGPEYGKRYAMQLLRRHRLKRAQKLSTVKNSGRLSQSSAHGPQFMTLFEGCYKGAMGAIVALRMDRSTGLLVGAGYGRHTLVWNVRSRKLLFKVYLKQQLRIVMLRYSGGGTNHELKALKLLQSQNVQHEKQQQDAEHRREEISEAQHNTPQQQKPSGPDVKQKQVNERQQPPQRVNKVLKGEKTVSRQKAQSRAYHSTEKSKQRKRRILRVEVQRRSTGQHQHQERQSRSNRQEKQSGVEEVRQGEHQGRARDTSAAGTGSAAVGSRQKTSITPDVKKKRKIG